MTTAVKSPLVEAAAEVSTSPEFAYLESPLILEICQAYEAARIWQAAPAGEVDDNSLIKIIEAGMRELTWNTPVGTKLSHKVYAAATLEHLRPYLRTPQPAQKASEEVVAKGMAYFDYVDNGLETLVGVNADEYCRTQWERYLPDAKAAIAAMQEGK